MRSFLVSLAWIAIVGGLAPLVRADDQGQTSPLVVATKESPPFAFKEAGGDWKGISIDLWRHVADELELEYEFREATLDEMIAGVASGEFDAAVAAISVTAERQRRLEFCHPHYTTGLGIAVRIGAQRDLWSVAKQIFSKRLLSIVGVMLTMVAACGLLFWRLERKVNQNLFGGSKRQGIETGVWWSLILLLGHKGVFPVSTAGRLVAAAAMFASLVLLSVLTGVIASVLTLQQLENGIAGPEDLRRTRVVTVESSTTATHLRQRRIAFRTAPTAEAALELLASGKADAVVYDKPLLRYLATKRFAESVSVLPISFNPQDYAIALPASSPLRKPFNTALLEYRSSDAWEDLIYLYLGE